MKKNLAILQFCGFVITVIVGTLLHFLYGWTNKSLLAAPFSAVNESTWEHMKLMYVPLFGFALIQNRFMKGFKATPLGDRLTALHAIFRQIFRHFRQNLLEIRQYSCVDFVNLTKNYARNLTRNLCAVLP